MTSFETFFIFHSWILFLAICICTKCQCNKETWYPHFTIYMWARSFCGLRPAIPSGWIECAGQSTTAYPQLSAIIGPVVPDLRGLFVRAMDDTRAVRLFACATEFHWRACSWNILSPQSRRCCGLARCHLVVGRERGAGPFGLQHSQDRWNGNSTHECSFVLHHFHWYWVCTVIIWERPWKFVSSSRLQSYSRR